MLRIFRRLRSLLAPRASLLRAIRERGPARVVNLGDRRQESGVSPPQAETLSPDPCRLTPDILPFPPAEAACDCGEEGCQWGLLRTGDPEAALDWLFDHDAMDSIDQAAEAMDKVLSDYAESFAAIRRAQNKLVDREVTQVDVDRAFNYLTQQMKQHAREDLREAYRKQ